MVIDPLTVQVRAAAPDEAPPGSDSAWDDWGDLDPEAAGTPIERWMVEVATPDGPVVVGHLSAHPVWHGPSRGSRAMNIGVSLVEAHRGRGIGGVAQRLLAEELHGRGIVRVEASTDVENLAEQRALAKAGFVLEGTLISAQARRDGRHDLQLWSHVDPRERRRDPLSPGSG